MLLIMIILYFIMIVLFIVIVTCAGYDAGYDEGVRDTERAYIYINSVKNVLTTKQQNVQIQVNALVH